MASEGASSTAATTEEEYNPTPEDLAEIEKRIRQIMRKAKQPTAEEARRKRNEKARKAFEKWKLEHRIDETPDQYWERIVRVGETSLKQKK